MVGATADDGTEFCNVYDNKTKSYCKKLKTSCTVHAAKRGAASSGSAGVAGGVGLGSGVGVNSGGNRRSRVDLVCGCPTGDFASGYLSFLPFLFHFPSLTNKDIANYYVRRAWSTTTGRSLCVRPYPISVHNTYVTYVPSPHSHYVLTMLQQNRILSELELEEKSIRLRMARRSQMPHDSHKTIVEA